MSALGKNEHSSIRNFSQLPLLVEAEVTYVVIPCPLSNKADMEADSRNPVYMRVRGLSVWTFLNRYPQTH